MARARCPTVMNAGTEKPIKPKEWNMKRLMLVTTCAVMVFSNGTVVVQAQDIAGGEQAALKAQLKELRQKVSDRDKTFEAQPAVVAAKQAAEAAAAARTQFEKRDAAYAAVSKAKSDAQAAYNKAVADALAKDTQYVAAKTQDDELGKKDNEPKARLKSAAPEARAAIEAEIAAIEAQQAPLKKTISERKKAVEEMPEVVAAKKAADDAKKAKDGFATSNPEYGKLIAAEKDARSAYGKAKNDAEAADVERTALQQQIRDLQKRIEASK